jgi:hypothetical protein
VPIVVFAATILVALLALYPVFLLLFVNPFSSGMSRERRALCGANSQLRDGIGRRKGRPLALVAVSFLTAFPALSAAQATTTTTLAVTSAGSMVATVVSGSVVTLTATVMAGQTPVTVGQVTFCDAKATYCTDTYLLGKAQLTKAGTATYRFRPGVGNHSYRAVFAGTPNGDSEDLASTSGIVPLKVTGLYPTATAVAISGGPLNYTLTATVNGTGNTAPTGTALFQDASNGNTELGTATLDEGIRSPSFLNVSNPAAGNGPTAVAVADFNGDGIPDLAVANGVRNTVTILLGNGDGTFTQTAVSPATGSLPVAIAVADFDGDGNLDLSVVCASGSVSILLGKGDGTFTALAAIEGLGNSTNSIAVGDFNGDGIPDLVVRNYMGWSVTVLLGKGDGTFVNKWGFVGNENFPGQSIVVGDFNGDGNLDLALPGFGIVTIMLGNGDGTFRSMATNPSTSCPLGYAVLSDFNGDGIPDLAMLDLNSNDLIVMLGNGDGTFNVASTSPIAGVNPDFVAVGDFNGDGIPDLAVANFGINTVTVLLGKGDGTFAATSATPATGDGPEGIAVGDFNGDGIQDLAVASGGNNTVTILQTATQSATATATGVTIPVATGAHQVVASYSGDSSDKASTSPSSILTAAQGTPTVTVSASANPVNFGASATLTATVAGSGLMPTGSVSFYNGSNHLCTAALKSGDVAACASNAFKVGSNSITAKYAGDSNYIAATSSAYTLSVTLATPAISLTTSSRQVPLGSPVTITATVAGAGAVPTGTVTFLGGTAQLGQGGVNGSGVATYTTSSMAIGVHSVTAGYGGDSNYTPVTSAALSETVIPATSTTLAVTSTRIPVSTVTSGSAVTLTATVQSNGTQVTTGTVNFCDATAAHCTDIHLLGTAQLTAAGTASTKFIPGIGSHSYKAVFAGTNSVGSSASAASALTVTGLYPTATTIAQRGIVGNYTLTATVGGIGPLFPTGQVSFLDASNGNAPLGTAVLGGGASALNFVTASNPPDGDGATSVAVGDFNGDGILDFAVANFNTNTISVFLGDGTGNFTQTADSPPTSDNPIAIVAGDFNGDGILDLAVANYGEGSVGILLGDGKGNFTPTASPIVTGNNPDAIALGDFNGDGKLDLAVTNYADNTMTVLLGDGKGNFTTTAAKPATGWEPQSIATADFNGDGIADLAVANGCGSDATCKSAGSVTILLGKGDGTFTAASASPATDIDPYAIVAGDFNGDGKIDLAVANFKGEDVTVLLGNGDGTFTATAKSPATGNGPYSIAFGDFNGDGIPDLVTANYDDNTLTVLLGDGAGKFTPMEATPLTGQYPVAVAVGDFNGDGWPDMAVANYYDSTMTVLLTASTATATAAVNGIAPLGAGNHLASATYAGDSNYAGSSSGTTALTGQATSTTTLAITSADTPVTSVAWGSAVTLTATVQAGGAAVTPGKVNFCDATAAHCTDIHMVGTAQLTSAGTASIKLVPAAGIHSYKAVFPGITGGSTLRSASASGVASLTVSGTTQTTTMIAESGNVGNYTLTATVTGAGVAAPTGTVSFLDTSNGNALLATALLGPGAAGLNFLNASSPATGAVPWSTAVGDFNGDGIPDLAVANNGSNTVTILLGNGDGTFSAASASPATGSSPWSIAAGDFNGDGIPDLAVANYSSKTVTILLGNGDGTFRHAATSPAAGSAPVSIAEGDFNGDGNLDLAVANLSSNTVTILFGNGDGTFTTAAASPATGNSPNFVAVGDFNRDGILDLATTNAFSNTVTILLGNGDGTFKAASASPATGVAPESIAVGDFNGDGIPDLAVANFLGNTVTILLGNGDGTFRHAATSPAAGSAPVSIAVGDFNGDGILDLATANAFSNTVTVLIGKGDGAFTAASASPATGSNPTSIAEGDFNGDGKTDLAVANQSTNTVTVLLAQTQSATAAATGIAPVGTGAHLIDASYGGDVNYTQSTSHTVGLTAKLLPPELTISASNYNVNSGTPVTFTAKIIESTAPPKFKNGKAVDPMLTKPAPTGTTTFYAGTTSLGSTTLNSLGEAIFTTSKLPAGEDNITAHYSGDSHFAATTSIPVTVTVAYKPQPKVMITPSADPISYGASVTLTATLTSSGTAKPTGTVAFLNGATQLGTAALNASGVAKYAASKLPGGKDSITAAYLGDINYGQNTSSATVVTVNRVAPAVILASSVSSALAGTTVTLTATLTGAGVAPSGTVTFLNGAVSLGTGKMNSSGVATLATNMVPAGKNGITASYAGDANYTPCASSEVTVSVTPKPIPTATLTSSVSTITYGSSVTLTVTLSASGAKPTGTVTFLDGAMSLGAGTLNTSGVATLMSSKVPGGKNTITASYQGDARYASVASAPVSVMVNKAAPSVKLASSVSSITYGGSATLTATLSGIGAKPTGTVTFLAGSKPLGTGTLNSSGVATLTTSKLPAGTDSVTTSYAGDTNYAAGASPVVRVTVSKVTLTVTANNQSKAYGAALPALTYTLSGFVNGDTAATATTGTAKPTTTATAKSTVGSYPIMTTVGTLSASNYTLKLAPATFVVTKAVLTVAANNASVAYNQPLPSLTYAVTGFMNGDTFAVFKGDPLETTAAEKGSKAGTYPIKITQGTLVPTANYSLAFKNGTLTIQSN